MTSQGMKRGLPSDDTPLKKEDVPMCMCKKPICIKSTKDGREFYACDNRKLENKTWGGGCGFFVWSEDMAKIPLCKEHNIAKCICLVDARVTEAMKLKVPCFCGLPARAAVTKTDPSYVFFNCGAKRIKAGSTWKTACPFWAREDELKDLTICDTCEVPQSLKRKTCWKCVHD